jgi:hypothetical protein
VRGRGGTRRLVQVGAHRYDRGSGTRCVQFEIFVTAGIINTCIGLKESLSLFSTTVILKNSFTER